MRRRADRDHRAVGVPDHVGDGRDVRFGQRDPTSPGMYRTGRVQDALLCRRDAPFGRYDPVAVMDGRTVFSRVISPQVRRHPSKRMVGTGAGGSTMRSSEKPAPMSVFR